MNSSTTSPLGQDFPRQMVSMILDAFNEGEKQAYRMIWEGFKQFAVEHWGWILIGLAGLLLLAIFEYLVTRRWAFLGSVLYHYFYLSFLLVLTLIFGPEIYASEWMKLVLFIVYVICYVLVGKVLTKSGVRKRYR